MIRILKIRCVSLKNQLLCLLQLYISSRFLISFFLLILFNLWLNFFLNNLLILILTICTHQGRHEFDLLLVFIKSLSYFCGTLFLCCRIFCKNILLIILSLMSRVYVIISSFLWERENILCWLNHVWICFWRRALEYVYCN